MVIALSIVICVYVIVIISKFTILVTTVLASHQESTLPSVYMAKGFGPFDLPTYGTPFPWSLANFVVLRHLCDIVLTSVELRLFYQGYISIINFILSIILHCSFVGVYTLA